MALRIPVIDRQVSIPGDAGQPRASPQQAGALAGQVADASAALARQADQLEDRIQQQRDVVATSKAVADARLFWVRRVAEMEAAAPADGSGHEQRLTQEFGDYQAKALQALSPTARPAFAARIETLQASLLGRALEFERAKRVAATVNAFADTANTALAAVYQDAQQLEPVIGDLTGMVRANAYLPADKKDELLRSMQQQAAVSLFSGMIDRGDLDSARARLGSGEFNAALGPRGLNQMNDQLQRAFDRREAQAAAAERSRLAKLAVTVRAGIRDDLAAAEARGSGAGKGGAWLVPEEQIRAIYEPDQAEQVIEQRNAATDLHAARLAVRTAAPEELQKLLQAQQPADGPGFAKGVRRQRALLQAAQERAAGLQASPGDYVVDADASVAAAFERGELRDAARLSIELQRRMGVPDDRVEALGKSRAARLAAQINAGTADDALAALGRDGLPARFGEHWPRVYAELQRAGLSGAVIALPLVGDAVAASELAIAVRTPAAELKKAVPTDVDKDINKALDEYLVPLRRSLGRAPDGAARGNDLRDAMHRLALRYAGQGQDAKTAAEAAYNHIVGNNYEFDGTDYFRVRKPATAADMRRAVGALLDLTHAEQLQTPPPSGDAQGQLPDAERRAALLQRLRAGEFTLITNENDSGVVLASRVGTPLLDHRGQRIEVATRNIPMLLEAGRVAREALAAARQQEDSAAEQRADDQISQRVRDAAARAIGAVSSPPSRPFAERFKDAMTVPSARAAPAQPLTSNIDLLDLIRRAIGSEDTGTLY